MPLIASHYHSLAVTCFHAIRIWRACCNIVLMILAEECFALHALHLQPMDSFFVVTTCFCCVHTNTTSTLNCLGNAGCFLECSLFPVHLSSFAKGLRADHVCSETCDAHGWRRDSFPTARRIRRWKSSCQGNFHAWWSNTKASALMVHFAYFIRVEEWLEMRSTMSTTPFVWS